MKSIGALHNEAMNLAEEAFVAQKAGKYGRAKTLFKKAFVLERDAATSVADDHKAEPSRSVLLRSAASLAIDCGDHRESERLIAIALSGNPPPVLAAELRDLWEMANFSHHLRLRGYALHPGELRMSLAGGTGVSRGFAESALFLRRAETMEKALIRTAERQQNHEFREAGSTKTKGFEVYFSVPMAASFAIAVRIGTLERTHELRTLAATEKVFLGPDTVVDEFLTCLDMFGNNDRKALRERIEETAYFNNFVALARKLAPDGEKVKQVGFTTIRAKQEKTVALTRPPDEVWTASREIGSEVVTLQGVLRAADGLTMHRKHSFSLETDDKSAETIFVAKGMLEDIVRPHWGTSVVVKAEKEGTSLHLLAIDPVEQATR
jgi:hypothetical protein